MGRRFTSAWDLGQSRDSTVGVAGELVPRSTLGGTPLPPEVHVLDLRSMARGTDYTDQVAAIVAQWRRMYFLDAPVVLDASGLGAPVRDALRSEGVQVIGVTATGGDAESLKRKRGGQEDWTVSRVRLLNNLAGLVYSNRLKIAAALPEAPDLLRELGDLEVRISAAGAERIEVASTEHHADRVSAVALAAWWLLRPAPVKTRLIQNPFRRGIY